jgi:DNA polymerase III subunit delta'
LSKAPADIQHESDVYDGAPHPRLAQALFGHDAAEAELLEGYRSQRLAHAWLVGGAEGIGKATLAWRFARFILANPDPASANVRQARNLSVGPDNPAARQVAALAHPDLSILRRGWNPKSKNFFSEIGVDGVRAAVDLFHKFSSAGGWRICIVDCAEDLNRFGANALLKMIEEPPARSLFLIAAHRPGQVLPTIRSRCRKLALAPLDAGQIALAVASLGGPWSDIPDDEVAEAARNANGSVREALKRLNPEARAVRALIDQTIAQLPNADFRAVHKLADAVAGRGEGDAFEALMSGLYDWLAQRLRTSAPDRPTEAVSDLWERIRAQTRETEALNLDRKLHVLSIFAEFSAVARRI